MPKIQVTQVDLPGKWSLPLTYEHKCVIDDNKPCRAGCEYVRTYLDVKRCGDSRCQRCYPHGFPCECKSLAKP